MYHYMIDVETLDILPTAVVLSIGAVCINENLQVDDEFYIKLDIEEQMAAGSTVSDSTVQWWLKQDPVVQENTFGGTATMKEACNGLDSFMPPGRKMVWARGADFDFPVIDNLFRKAGYVNGRPWRYYHQCDMRTMCNFFPAEYYLFPDEAANHNALDDAKVQARGLIKMLGTIDFLGIRRTL